MWKREDFRAIVTTRMIEHNPMKREEIRAKVSANKAGQAFPTHRGGKGQPAPVWQSKVAEALGLPMEITVVVHKDLARRHGLSRWTWYALDVADEMTKHAVEVNGGSHKTLAVQARDARKMVILKELGWSVLVVTNQELSEDFDATMARVRGFMTSK
ncbi:MAG: DUF559 domain-containing protein [Phycisphaerae bacterium]|jgi:hypothetical protein